MEDRWVVMVETWAMTFKMVGLFMSRESAQDWADRHQNTKSAFDATVFKVCDANKED